MWLYVPNLSTSSASAPEDSGSISPSNWRFHALEASVWWRGKPFRSRIWFQRWNRVLFIQRLCGRMPEPSTAALGVAAWTASLAASRASRIASPGESRAGSTSGTCGPTRAASSSSRAHGSSSSKTSRGCSRQGLTKSLAPNGFGETYRSWASRLRADCSRRQKSARAMNANGSSSSAWPTMTAGAAGKGADQVRRDTGQRGGSLTEAMTGTSLTQQVNTLWSTPRSSDGEKGGPNQAFGAGGVPLLAQTAQWATPQARDHMPPHSPERIAAMKAEGHGMRNLNDEAAYFRPAPETSQDGKPHSKERRSLNPLFVEWLMGWPPMWVRVSTSCGCSATALSRWKAHMRSELSALGSPAEAPPPQLALFA